MRKTVVAAAIGVAAFAATVTPAFGTHDHFVVTPNGKCHQVAKGSTARHHRYHENVHLGATGTTGTPGDANLGHGNGRAAVYKDRCP